MSTPPELILVWCHCGAVYSGPSRPSMNLSIEHFDDEYVERMSSTSCPNCRSHSRLGTLLTRFENDHLSMQFEPVTRQRQVILYLDQPKREQSETLTWIKNWVTQKGYAGVVQLEKILDPMRDSRSEFYGVYAELLDILLEWKAKNEWGMENEGKEPELPPGTV